MPFQLLFGLFFALLFFIALPLGGAFTVRKRWRKFRHTITTFKQQARYSGGFDHTKSWTGLIYGFVEGVQGSTSLWIRAQGRSIKIPVQDADLYVLAGKALNNRAKSLPEPPVHVAWKQVGALPEGARLMVYGTLTWHHGRLQINAAADQKGPFIVLYEGDDASLLRRLISNGRQQNEFWNLFTPFGILIGFVLLAILAMSAFQVWPNRLWGILLTTLAIMPFSILLPPGIVAYYGYRYLWRRSRRIRVRRDLFDLQDGPNVQRRRALEKKATQLELVAVGIFLSGIIINSSLVLLLSAQLAAVK